MRVWLAVFALFVPSMLLLDAGLPRQLALGTARRFGIDARQILCAIVVATTEAVVLSGLWLFYAMAVITARNEALQRHAHRITATVLIAGTIGAIASLVYFGDAWGASWWAMAATLIVLVAAWSAGFSPRFVRDGHAQ